MIENKHHLPTPPSEGTITRLVVFEKALKDYQHYLFRYLWRITGDNHLARELSQELWISVYRYFKIHEFFEVTLLKRRAYQVYLRYMRKKDPTRYLQPTEFVLDDSQLVCPDSLPGSDSFNEPATPEEEEGLKERFWARFVGIRITPQQKEAFWLRHREGMTLAEVAERMDVSTTTVHDWLAKLQDECTTKLNREDV